MNKRRLLKLADLLEADAENKKGIRFDMHQWGRVYDADAPISCGTSACAMGLAGLSGTFKQAGFDATFQRYYGRVRLRWKGRIMDGFKIAVRLFGITMDQAETLFAPSTARVNNTGAAGERAKARQIRKFVATGVLSERS